MTSESMAARQLDDAPDRASPGSERPCDQRRLRKVVDESFDFVGRSLRSLGVPEAEVDDALQQVFIAASRRLGDVQPGAERAWLFRTAIHIAAHVHRSRRRHPERVAADLPERRDSTPGPEELADLRRAREILDEVLDAMPLELRAVFVLAEVEDLAVPQIAQTVGVPLGTAASRLQRARKLFQSEIKRVRALMAWNARGGRR
jgi:RNA polymerase sigma-70 factor (ECF subfamily)